MNIRAVAADEAARVSAVINECLHLEGPLLPILHAVQEEFGYIPESAKQIIASALNISRAEVHGVVTFYPDFRDHPQGRHARFRCRIRSISPLAWLTTLQAPGRRAAAKMVLWNSSSSRKKFVNSSSFAAMR